ncbi:exosortase E/protease, VPEID-CTERM system [Terricaulis silvestris]|uniref:Exosortase E/protease, VPEID-CTERM system n=2 Tax=Terricaulis silvestris TaxID=2686094 RepID=A0A6I6MRQ0_9CAUL|nr:exosortase E/protease, VPEID-CTERM system [Terricaulis silvestris]
MNIGDRAAHAPKTWRIGARGAALALLLLVEIVLLDGAYSFRDIVGGAPSPAWRVFNDTLQVLVYVALYAGIAFCFLAFAQSRAIVADWLTDARTHRWGRWLGAQTVLFLGLLAALSALSGANATPWAGVSLWMAAAGAMVVCAVIALAPISFWFGFARKHAGHAIVALAFGALTYAAIEFSRNSWHDLSAATLYTSHWLLQLYEPSAFIDVPNRMLGALDFRVIIGAPCSGYEGVGLVLGMMSFYIFAFRRDLRFPHVLVLLPLGALTIWVLNAVRLTLLVSMGAHVSPEVAINGFHSQAGWVFFLTVTISLMLIAHRAPIFRAHPVVDKKQERDPALYLAAALLTPFAALMAARIGGAVFGDSSRWAGVLLIAIPVATIWIYRDAIRGQLAKIGAEPWLVGLAVGGLWIVTEPAAETSTLGAWLETQPPAAAAAWLALRIFGFALIVPIVEELAFRGYLHRALISRRFEAVAPGAFTWVALIVTSVLFGALHGRWLAGALAGAAFAITLYRSKTLSGAIAAHVAANGIIAIYAVMMERWELL